MEPLTRESFNALSEYSIRCLDLKWPARIGVRQGILRPTSYRYQLTETLADIKHSKTACILSSAKQHKTGKLTSESGARPPTRYLTKTAT